MLFFTKVEFILYLFQELLEIKKFIFRTLERVRGGGQREYTTKNHVLAILGRSEVCVQEGWGAKCHTLKSRHPVNILLVALPLSSSGSAAIGDWKGPCTFQISIFG